ncbi:winged helix-turn-helix transcriptional regulator [Actinoplanes sp. NPDC049265]|uniref:winged helix-turn-helix transcriptional regulator n=1 Tax=Actinoplanes sp. NPDC049265 TaxID=3363902 RepID=UPI0037207657
MSPARTYGDGCGIAHALDLIGERWALLVVRELFLGPLRFSELRAGLPGASPTLLAQRLRDLERSGVVARRRLPPPAAASLYELTRHGAELEPILIALGSWGLRSRLSPAGPVSPTSAMLTLRTYHRPAPDWPGTVEVRLGDRRYLVSADGDAFVVTTGDPPPGTPTVTSDPGGLLDLLGDEPIVQAATLRATPQN